MLPLRDDNPTQRTPYLTIALILINVVVYFGVQPQQGEQAQVRVGEATASVPADVAFNLENAAIPCEVVDGEALTVEEINSGACAEDPDASPVLFPNKNVLLALLTSMFLHGSIVHLGGNMLFLWIFGNNIEDRLGSVRYLAFYLAAGLAATVAHIAVQPDSAVPVVGASGAIAGVMGAYLVWFPHVRILALVFIFLQQISAKWLLAFWFVSQFFVNPNEGVAWVAHVGGFVFGVAIGLLVRGSVTAQKAALKRTYRQPDDHWRQGGGQGGRY